MQSIERSKQTLHTRRSRFSSRKRNNSEWREGEGEVVEEGGRDAAGSVGGWGAATLADEASSSFLLLPLFVSGRANVSPNHDMALLAALLVRLLVTE